MSAEQAFEECLSRGGHWLQSAQINFMDKLLALAACVIRFIGYRDGLAAFRPLPLYSIKHVTDGRVGKNVFGWWLTARIMSSVIIMLSYNRLLSSASHGK